jgi:predicted transcriptional regulator
MTTKESLHRLIDHLPERELEAIHRFAGHVRFSSEHPAMRAILSAPLDDEPETPEEAEAVREGLADLAAGRVIPDADLAL